MDFKKNKGQVQTMAILVILIVAFGMLTYLGYSVFKDINDEIQSDSSISELTKNTTQVAYNQYPSLTDGISLMIFGFFWIFILISAYLSDSNPVLFIVSIIFMIILMLGSGLLNNMWVEFAADFSSYESSFPITNFIMGNLLLLSGVMFVSSLIVAFVKGRAA